MKTYIAKEQEVEESKRWYIVDAEGKVLGRLASQIAHILRGKHKPIFSPHQDVGDFVIVINAEKVKLTGNKMEQKTYFRHSGYIGGTTFTPVSLMLKKHPERVIEFAVKRMLPKNALGRKVFKKLKVYAGTNHPHQAQKPEVLDIKA
ncbi:MAG: 50S ribosomal protein L13 [Calditrichaeota bacterium]|nr:50S ribosomal protein L13 [Calditrichota bacterium]